MEAFYGLANIYRQPALPETVAGIAGRVVRPVRQYSAPCTVLYGQDNAAPVEGRAVGKAPDKRRMEAMSRLKAKHAKSIFTVPASALEYAALVKKLGKLKCKRYHQISDDATARVEQEIKETERKINNWGVI